MGLKRKPEPFNRRDALKLWHRVSLCHVIEAGPDLTARQFVILTTVYLEAGPHTVRSLAVRLNVTKAVVVRALDTLSRYRFIARTPDPRDRRSVLIRQTGSGGAYLSQFADQIRQEMMPSEPQRIAVA